MANFIAEQISSKDLSDIAPSSQKENRPSSAEKKPFMEHSNTTIHWFAQIGGSNNNLNEAALSRDREEKLRLIRERQNDERQRKIDELKAQAEAAQKYREQREEERRRRIEELRSRDNDRRQQVEERKKAIIEAEKERREYILRKNQEREARLDTKKRNERSSITFAFGSSVPRLLDPAELGGVSPSAFWGHRRSTSITNVAYTGAPLTRRSSERELADGSKKRATSAGGIDRQSEEETTDSANISYRSVYRRKTDLMPTIPSPREPSFGSKSSLHSQAHTPKTPGSRSGEITPRGSSINTSRPGSAMSTSTTASGFIQRRSTPAVRKPRPASIAVTGVSLNDEQKHKKDKPPLPKIIQNTPKRSGVHTNSILKTPTSDGNKSIERKLAAKRDIVPNRMSISMTQSVEQKVMKNAIGKEKEIKSNNNIQQLLPIDTPQTKEEKDALNTVKTETNVSSLVINDNIAKDEEQDNSANNDRIIENVEVIQNVIEQVIEQGNQQQKEQTTEKVDDGNEKEKKEDNKENSVDRSRELSAERQENEMTASMIARSKITTEEEAKAALAERRRLAREEADKQAELEKQRIEKERQAELRRQAEEEERQKKFEEEALRLAEEQRKAENERLLQAIKEAKKRELEEKLKREEEERLKAEKEEIERKAKEEAEKLREEMDERLKREEKEREERRKRVEAIMSRTRAKGGNSTPNSTPVKENENSKEQNSNNKQSENEETSVETMTINNVLSKESTENKINTEKNSIEQQQQQQLQMSYEESVTQKENSLMRSFNNMIIDENAKNIQNVMQHQNQNQNPLMLDMTNGKMIVQPMQPIQNEILVHPIANGNGHIENNLNENETNNLIDISTDQLIDFNNQQQQQQMVDVVNFNNNSLLTTTSGTLVTADSHENKEISLL